MAISALSLSAGNNKVFDLKRNEQVEDRTDDSDRSFGFL